MNEEIQRINLDDYIQTGEGGTALTYTHKDGLSLAKLYNPGFEADRAKAEFLTARAVFELGIPSPEPFRLITDGQRSGAEYELIKNKRSYTRIISQEPERLEEISLKFARMAKELHAKQADTTRLQSYKQRIANFYHEKDMVPEDYKQRVLQFLDTVPDTPRCLHGDLHIGNIITDGQSYHTRYDAGPLGHILPSLSWHQRPASHPRGHPALASLLRCKGALHLPHGIQSSHARCCPAEHREVFMKSNYPNTKQPLVSRYNTFSIRVSLY